MKDAEKINLGESYNKLFNKAKLDIDFSLLAVSAMIICVLGLSINSPSVVIGSMLVSPLIVSFLAIPSTIMLGQSKGLLKALLYLLVE